MATSNRRMVYIIVDRSFGERLYDLEPETGVWIVGSPINRPIIERIWKERHSPDHLTGITSFDDMTTVSPEALLVAQLDSVDLHFGVHSAVPPYSVIEVIGTPLTSRLEEELSAYQFREFHPTSSGFRAVRLDGS